MPAGTVGVFPTFGSRRVIRGPVNPMDKSTVVSILPKEIDEKKCTIQPGRFIVTPGTFENPSVLVVGPSSWWRDIDGEQPLLEIPTSSIQIAESIVNDYISGMLGCNMADSMPGLFYVPGCKFDNKGEPSISETVKWIKSEYKKELEAANVRQKNWYSILVRLADSLWATSNGNPVAISGDMRLAARELSLTAKDWMRDFQAVEMVRCKACGSLKNPQYPICASCHFPDPEHPMTKQLMDMKNQIPGVK